jgi:hypothetical protein
VFAGVKEEPVRTDSEQGGHADLADGSTGAHPRRARLSPAYFWRRPAAPFGLLVVRSLDLHDAPASQAADDGSTQASLWGINPYPAEHGTPRWIEFDSMINVRPRQGNRTRSVNDPETRRKITAILNRLVAP